MIREKISHRDEHAHKLLANPLPPPTLYVTLTLCLYCVESGAHTHTHTAYCESLNQSIYIQSIPLARSECFKSSCAKHSQRCSPFRVLQLIYTDINCARFSNSYGRAFCVVHNFVGIANMRCTLLEFSANRPLFENDCISFEYH